MVIREGRRLIKWKAKSKNGFDFKEKWKMNGVRQGQLCPSRKERKYEVPS